MIDIIGMKRILTIAIIAGFAIILFAAAYFLMVPQTQTLNGEYQSVSSQASGKRSEVLGLRQEFTELQGTIRNFRILEEEGFFVNQNRLEASEIVENFRDIVGLIKARLEIDPGEILENQMAQEAGHVYLQSKLNLSLEAQDDLEIFAFLKLMQDRFPGELIIEEMSISKTRNLDEVVLRQIGTGTPVTLIQANLIYNWITIPAEEDLE
ncbi:MAG: hypothetical protein CL565_01965 [Alphaproteobacteria bacterium]|nr:hypothetical protein [Alphaproteobacteria bacterium]